MAGVPSATLEGWAIPMVGRGGPDHTYAVSSCGLRWPCPRVKGRSVGGARLSFAIGSSAIADCLSQPNSTAGIRYGRTGVCHQMANRILHPAGITVAGCGGYIMSVAAYGVHGRPPWPELSACYTGASVSAPGAASATPAGNPPQRASVYYTPQSVMERNQLTEFLSLVESALGHRIEEPARRSIQKIHKDFVRQQTGLVHVLDLGIVDHEEYLRKLNLLLNTMMERMRISLGEERFNIVFGEAGKHPETLVDPDTFSEAIASEGHRPAR
jgi:hypothetical protein